MEKRLFFAKNSAYFITDVYNRRYFSGINCAEGFLIKTINETVYFADARYYSALREALKGTEIKAVLYNSINTIKEFIKERKIKTLYIDYTNTTLSQYNSYKQFGVKMADGSKSLLECRQIKNKQEIENISKACEISEKAFNYVLPYVKSGVTEVAIKEKLLKYKRAKLRRPFPPTLRKAQVALRREFFGPRRRLSRSD